MLLAQLAPGQPRDDARLAYVLGQQPDWMRVAVVLRHPSWHEEAVLGFLARHRAAYCVMSGAGLPCVLRATAPFVYVRLHGPNRHRLYGGSYSDQDLAWWGAACRNGTPAGGTSTSTTPATDGNAFRNAERLRALIDL